MSGRFAASATAARHRRRDRPHPGRLAKPVAAAAGGLALTGAAMVVQARRDAKAIANDPECAVLARPVEGRAVRGTSNDGTVLHAEVFGSDDAPTIVFVHRWTCSLQFWHYQLRELAGEFRLVAFDLRGHGRSEPGPDGDYSRSALAADLDAVLGTCLHDGERAVVVAHSMGAMAIVAWAGEHPGEVERRVAGAVLANTGIAGLVREAQILVSVSALAWLQRGVGGSFISLRLPLPRRPSPPMFHAARLFVLGPDATPAQVAFAERLILAVPRRVRGGFGTMLADIDLRDAAPSLTVPTVVVVAERDRLTPPAHGTATSAALPDVQVVELPRVGHFAPVEAHEELSGRIRNLVELVLAPTEPGE